ncbi:MAG TPA: HAD family hydrolase [Steroidobacteraceae bacterium]|nr:HAD family hydrolase [Steroidobacteraceae bacterium]
MSSPFAGVVLLDRDGTIVIDRDYLDDPGQLEFLPGAAAGLRLLHERGIRVVVITNQSGVGRGRFSLERLEEIHRELRRMVQQAGAQIEGIYFCPHSPEEGCACRKPNTQLVIQAAAALGFDPASSVVIGDKASDIELGRRIGAVTMLISADAQPPSESARPDYIVRDLLEAAQLIADVRAIPLRHSRSHPAA